MQRLDSAKCFCLSNGATTIISNKIRVFSTDAVSESVGHT